MKILVSACLLGVSCRYDGIGKEKKEVRKLMDQHHLIPVCPEIMGGLATPRVPAERVGDRVVTRDGADVTSAYQKGAWEVLRLAKLFGCEAAVLKEKSPSCGKGQIYDGTFTNTLIEGKGVLSEYLEAEGIPVYGESQLEGGVEIC